MLAALHAEGLTNVGIVFNFHHAHDYTRTFVHLWPRLSPHVIAINLNGMVPGGDRSGQKIHPLNEGTEELSLLRVIRASAGRATSACSHTSPNVTPPRPWRATWPATTASWPRSTPRIGRASR